MSDDRLGHRLRLALAAAALVLVGGLIGIAAKATNNTTKTVTSTTPTVSTAAVDPSVAAGATTSFSSPARSAMVCRDAVASLGRCPR
jgi:hypothetical protein